MEETKLQYTVIRSARKTLSLSVDREGGVVVRAPRGVGVREISAFVRRHARWIEKRRAALAAAPVPDFTDGAILTLYGRRYTVAAGRTRIGGDTVYLPAEGRERALAALLKRLAKDYMGNLTAIYAERYGFSYQSVRITSARGRWGSCNANGAIAFSFRTAFLSEAQARYVAVHELCHTRHLDHGPAFWREVEEIIPDYAAIRASLRAASVVMTWL